MISDAFPTINLSPGAGTHTRFLVSGWLGTNSGGLNLGSCFNQTPAAHHTQCIMQTERYDYR